MKKESYTPPASELSGYRTFVSPTSEKGLPGPTSKPEGDPNGYPQQALPAPKGTKSNAETHMGPATYGKPDETTKITERPRTLPEPGEQRGVPVNVAVPGLLAPRRVDATEEKIRYRPEVRQRKQRGRDKWLSRRRYLKNREKLKSRARRNYKRKRLRPSFKKNQQIRRQNPNRFKRKRASEVLEGIAFSWPGIEGITYVDSLLPETERVLLKTPHGYLSTSIEVFLRKAAFLTEGDLERAFQMVDTEVGWEAYDEEPPSQKEEKQAGYVFFHEEKNPESLWNNWKGENTKGTPDGRTPTLPSTGKWTTQMGEQNVGDSPNYGHGLSVSETNAPASSAKVIPEQNTDLVNKQGMSMEEFRSRLEDKKAHLRSYDSFSDTWTFDCGKETVKISKSLSGGRKFDFRCTCESSRYASMKNVVKCSHVEPCLDVLRYIHEE
jgi:hypothetical protein